MWHNAVITVTSAREVEDTLRTTIKAELDLSKLPDNVKRPVITALNRGYMNALSGKAAYHYSMLAVAFNFPVFQLGRTDRCVLSFERSRGQEWLDGLVADLKNMWKLTLSAEQKDSGYARYGFHTYTSPGHNEHWTQLIVTRPQILTMDSICTLLGVGTIRDLVPLDRRMQALLALEQGQSIDISRHVEKQ